jgi:hypothetical protein
MTGQSLPVVEVDFTIEGPHYLERSPLIDADSLAVSLTSLSVELLADIDRFGFLEFRPRVVLEDSLNRPLLRIRFVEEAITSNEHRHVLVYEFVQTGSQAEQLGKQLVFGSTDDHLFYDQAALGARVSDLLDGNLLNDAFQQDLMRHAFGQIPVATTVQPDQNRFVHVPIPQSKLLAARGSRFAVEVSSSDVSRTSFMKVSVAFSASGNPNPGRTTCATDSLWFPTSTFVPDIDSRWDDVISLLTDPDSINVNIWTERFVPDRTPNVSNGVILPGE